MRQALVRVRLASLAVAVTLLFSAPVARGADTLLKDADYVAIIGDSITEQRLYSLYIEDYLLMCQPATNLRATQFGWGGETAPGFAGRMANDMIPFKPSVATTCFGMNDGGYGPLDKNKANRYREGQKSIVKQLRDAGVRTIIVGSPGCVDSQTFRGGGEGAATYNKTLAGLRDIAKDVAEEEKVFFANVYDPMFDAMAKAKAKYGVAYHVGGGDGVHPDKNGHLVMAYAFLKALGCSGDLGTITVDLKGNKAEATGGHKVLSVQPDGITLESTRYPFCFYGDVKQTNATKGILEFVPFNDDLNRLKLVVTGLTGGKAKVKWGNASKEFSAADLQKGINLAAEFLDNPFADAFRKVEDKIAAQQGMEVNLVKNLLHNLPEYKRSAPSESESLDRIASELLQKDKKARDDSAAAVTPVKHVLVIEALP